MRRRVPNPQVLIDSTALISSVLSPVIATAFRQMSIAERHLANKGLSKRKGAFLALTPPSAFRGKVEALYESHCRELCERMANSVPIDLGTDAECLVAIMEAAARSPLRSHIVQAAERLFRSVMPEDTSRKLGPIDERHPSEVTEFIEGLRKQVGKVRFK